MAFKFAPLGIVVPLPRSPRARRRPARAPLPRDTHATLNAKLPGKCLEQDSWFILLYVLNCSSLGTAPTPPLKLCFSFWFWLQPPDCSHPNSFPQEQSWVYHEFGSSTFRGYFSLQPCPTLSTSHAQSALTPQPRLNKAFIRVTTSQLTPPVPGLCHFKSA